MLPLVLGAAVAADRFGAMALAAGLALSFASLGLVIAVFGFALGIDAGFFRAIAAAIMIGLGVILLVPRLQSQLAALGGPFSNWADGHMGGVSRHGIIGQFALGIILGAVWSPCVGPTLGAASLLASQARDLPRVALTMFVFGIGAALPLVLLGFVSTTALVRMRARMLTVGQFGKAMVGVLFIFVGAAVVTGIDKRFEAILVDSSPAWLTDLTTRF